MGHGRLRVARAGVCPGSGNGDRADRGGKPGATENAGTEGGRAANGTDAATRGGVHASVDLPDDERSCGHGMVWAGGGFLPQGRDAHGAGGFQAKKLEKVNGIGAFGETIVDPITAMKRNARSPMPDAAPVPTVCGWWKR